MKFLSEEQINRFLNQYYRYLVWCLVILVLIIGIFTLLLPQYHRLNDTGIFENKEAESNLAERENYLADLRNMQQSYDDLEIRAWRSLDNILPKEGDVYLLFAQMETLARDNGLILSSININDGLNTDTDAQTKASKTAKTTATTNTSIADNIKTVNISLNLEGINSYENFKLFLDSIENNARILDIKSLSYSPEKSTYTVTLSTYYLYE